MATCLCATKTVVFILCQTGGKETRRRKFIGGRALEKCSGVVRVDCATMQERRGQSREQPSRSREQRRHGKTSKRQIPHFCQRVHFLSDLRFEVMQ